jgi:hypothetical protein
MTRAQPTTITCNHAARRNAAAKNQAVGSVIAKFDHGTVITEYRVCDACLQQAVIRLNKLL